MLTGFLMTNYKWCNVERKLRQCLTGDFLQSRVFFGVNDQNLATRP